MVKKWLHTIALFIIIWVIVILSLCTIYYYIIYDIPGLVVRNFIIVVGFLGLDLFWNVMLVINLVLFGIYVYFKMNKKIELLPAIKYNLIFWVLFFLLLTYVINFG